jgi:hypothetical protein
MRSPVGKEMAVGSPAKRRRAGNNADVASPLAAEAPNPPAKKPRIPKGKFIRCTIAHNFACKLDLPVSLLRFFRSTFEITILSPTLAGGRRGAALLAAAGGKQQSKDATISLQEALGRAATMPAEVRPSRPAAHAANRPLLTQKLPPKLLALKDAFVAVQTVYEMLRRRNKRTTFANLQPAIEEVSGRRFNEAHLAQLAALLPEALTLETTQTAAAARNARSALSHVLILSNPATGETPSMLRTMLHERLARHLLHSYAVHLKAEAAKKRAAGDADGAADLLKEANDIVPPITNFRAPFPDAVPDVGSTMQHYHSGYAARSSQSGGSSSHFSNLSSPRPLLSGAGLSSSHGGAASSQCTVSPTPLTEDELRRPGPRRLCFAPAVDHVAAAAAAEAAEKTDDVVLAGAPAELRRRSLDGMISLQALRALESNEARHRRLSTQEARDARDASAAIGALPKTFGRLRRIFGGRGPSAMKQDEVVRRLCEGSADSMTEAQGLAALRVLAEHAPDFVELKAWGSCGTPAVWVNRRCEANAIAARLKDIAGRRLSGEGLPAGTING